MTEVTLFRSGNRLAGFEAQGHSDYADEGEDIVCSAISALTQTAIMGIMEYLKLRCAFELDEGYAYCMLDDSIGETEWHEAEIIFETMALGLSSIADSYGDYIKLTEREV